VTWPGFSVDAGTARPLALPGSRPKALMAALLAFVVLAAVGALLVWLVLKSRELERRRDLERKVLARKEGWHYDGQRSGRIDYRFNGGADGIDWQMWFDSDRGDKSPNPRAYWSSTNLRTGELALVILGRRRYQMESGPAGRLIIGVVSGVAQAMTGQDLRPGKSDFYESAVEVTGGRTAFREAFAIAVAPDMPTSWLDDELQALLLDWPSEDGAQKFRAADSVEITLQSDGLRIVVQRMPQDIAYWAHLARLGQCLARRLVGARTQ
jgi:hypothetical protein